MVARGVHIENWILRLALQLPFGPLYFPQNGCTNLWEGGLRKEGNERMKREEAEKKERRRRKRELV